MAKNYHSDNKSFVIYKDWEEYVDALGSDEEAGKLFKALFAFAKRAEEAEFVGALKMAFIVMRNSIERDGEKWENTCSVRSDAGKKGGRPSKANDFSENQSKAKKAKGFFEKQTKAKKADKDTDKDTDTETDTDTEKEIHTPPTPSRGENAPKKRALKPKSDKTQFAEFVSMTNDEYTSLVAKVGEMGAKRCIEILDNYKGANGKKYESDYRAILNWVVTRYQEETAKPHTQPAPSKYEYDPNDPYANWD